MKRILVFILDIVLMVVFVVILGSIYVLIIFIISRVFYPDGLSSDARDIFDILKWVLYAFIIWAYEVWIPRKIGNTFAGKILKIKENLGHRGPLQYLKDTLFKKNKVLQVVVKDGYWECPSCKKKNKDKFNFCDDCGQEIIPKQSHKDS